MIDYVDSNGQEVVNKTGANPSDCLQSPARFLRCRHRDRESGQRVRHQGRSAGKERKLCRRRRFSVSCSSRRAVCRSRLRNFNELLARQGGNDWRTDRLRHRHRRERATDAAEPVSTSAIHSRRTACSRPFAAAARGQRASAEGRLVESGQARGRHWPGESGSAGSEPRR